MDPLAGGTAEIPRCSSSPGPYPRVEAIVLDWRYVSDANGLYQEKASALTFLCFTLGSLLQLFDQDGWDFHDTMADKRGFLAKA